MSETKKAYLSIGSNLGKKLQNLQRAIFLIEEKIGIVSAVSKVYQSESWGFKADDFLNACLIVESPITPLELLDKILLIEKELGRERSNKNGYQSRSIDIDIIYFEKEIIENEQLTLPHPKLQERLFVLRPLADVAPQFYHPILNKDSRNLIQQCRDKSALKKTGLKLFKNKASLLSSVQFMAIEGNIGSGKTTLANKIAKDYNAKLVLERFAENPFLPNFYKDQGRYAFPLEMSFLADRYQQYSDDTTQYDLFKNFMVSDYDIYKSLIFAKITLQKDEYDLYKKIFNFMYKEVQKPQIYIYLYQTTERLLANIKKRGRSYEQDIAPEYLENINTSYFDFIKSNPQQKSLIINISDMDFEANKEDYRTILRRIQNFVIEMQS